MNGAPNAFGESYTPVSAKLVRVAGLACLAPLLLLLQLCRALNGGRPVHHHYFLYAIVVTWVLAGGLRALALDMCRREERAHVFGIVHWIVPLIFTLPHLLYWVTDFRPLRDGEGSYTNQNDRAALINVFVLTLVLAAVMWSSYNLIVPPAPRNYRDPLLDPHKGGGHRATEAPADRDDDADHSVHVHVDLPLPNLNPMRPRRFAAHAKREGNSTTAVVPFSYEETQRGADTDMWIASRLPLLFSDALYVVSVILNYGWRRARDRAFLDPDEGV